MAKKEKKETRVKGFRKKIAKTLYNKMDGLLKEYEPLMGEKKYAKHLKRTVKTLAAEIAAAAKKNGHKEAEMKEGLPETPTVETDVQDDDD